MHKLMSAVVAIGLLGFSGAAFAESTCPAARIRYFRICGSLRGRASPLPPLGFTDPGIGSNLPGAPGNHGKDGEDG